MIMEKFNRLLRAILYGILGFYLGTMLGKTLAKADDNYEVLRIGIFTQPNGTETIEICEENKICKHFNVPQDKLKDFNLKIE